MNEDDEPPYDEVFMNPLPERHSIAVVPKGYQLVPIAALQWLHGEAPNAEGKWFGDCEDGEPKPRGRWWWRSVFRKMCVSPAPVAGVEVEGWQLVPKEPDGRMVVAGSEGIDGYYNGTKDAPFEGSVAACYRAMLAAASAAQGEK